MSEAVVLDHVIKVFGQDAAERRVLDDFSLIVPEGQFVSVMGPSGCGKSTLLNMIGALDVPTSGRVIVGGKPLDELNEEQRSELRRRYIGVVFQDFNLLPRISVFRNVAWRLSLVGVYGRRARHAAEAALRLVDVPTDAWHRLPPDLSGGEQQRVALARALATKPKLLLADEPTGNLDALTGEHVIRLLQTLNRNTGMSIVMVTHDLSAGGAGHRTVQMRDGRIIRDISISPAEVEPFRRSSHE